MRELLPEIYSLAIMRESNTLEKAIESTKKAEMDIDCMKRNFMEMKILDNTKENIKLEKKRRRQICYKCTRKGHIST